MYSLHVEQWLPLLLKSSNSGIWHLWRVSAAVRALLKAKQDAGIMFSPVCFVSHDGRSFSSEEPRRCSKIN